jgi:hypothetical protein
MQGKTRWGVVLVVAISMFGLTGCDKLADTSRAAQSVTKAAFEDTKSSWRDFFMYHPPMPDPLPQTRYCYQMQSDVVCYDSEQAGLTSKMIGYQDGENISWVQPGGGSLGASGGEPIALRPIPKQPMRVATQNYNSMDAGTIDTGPIMQSNSGTSWSSSATSSNTTNFTVPKSSGEIDINPLPPTAAQKR